MRNLLRRSKNVIDRRKGLVAGVVLTVIGFFAALFGRPLQQDPDDGLIAIVSTALDRGQAFWREHLPRYRAAQVVLFDGVLPTPCGQGTVSSGPFYCPADERIYLDLSFLRDIHGDLARAYVIAHELGHHVQKLRRDDDGASVSVELQADCYAGAWMASERRAGNLEGADLTLALAEASAVGDDRLCPSCAPDSFSHGSASQRVAAVSRGLAGAACVF